MSLDDKAAGLAGKHGSFSLHFDSTQNPASPDYRPWTLTREVGGELGRGALTADEALDSALADLPGLPRFAVVKIEWTQGGDPVSQTFGPWMIAPDDSHMAAISGFVQGWSRGAGAEPALVTLTTGDESIAEGATCPYRDQPASPSRPPAG